MMAFLLLLYLSSFVVITLVNSKYALMEYAIAIIFLLCLTQFLDFLFFRSLSDK